MHPMAFKPRRVTRIGQRPKLLFLGDWMAAHDPPLTAAMLAERTGLDKSQISRWVNNVTKPQDAQLERLAAFFQVDPESLLRHPDDDWMKRFFDGRQKAERESIKEMLERAWPKKA